MPHIVKRTGQKVIEDAA